MCKSRSLTKAREKLYHSAGDLSDCDTLFFSLPVPLKHSVAVSCVLLKISKPFYFLQIGRFRADFVFVTLSLTTFFKYLCLVIFIPLILYRFSIYNDCIYMKIMYVPYGEDTNITTELVVEIGPEKNSGPYGI